MTEQIQKIDTQNREIEEVFQALATLIQKRYGASEILQ